MEKKIGQHENMKLVEKIVLNGKVGYVDTKDDNGETIGIKNVIKRPTFSGEELVDENSGFALTKEMEQKLDWGNKYASIRFVIGDNPIDPIKVEETIIQSYFGIAEAEYSHRYSDYTGYLWTDEGFVVGGHDIPEILKSNVGKFIHMEIELYEETKRK